MFHDKGVFGTPMQTGLGVWNPFSAGIAPAAPAQIPRPTYTAPYQTPTTTKPMKPCPTGTKGEWRCQKSSGPDQCDKWLWYCPTGKKRIGLKRVTRVQATLLKLPLALPSQVKTTMFTLGSQMGVPTIGGMPQVGFEERDGLWYVQPAAAPILVQMLGAMKTDEYQWNALTKEGWATAVVGPPSGQALAPPDAATFVHERLSDGAAVLIEKASLPTGKLRFEFTNSASRVAKLASGPAATHASLYDQPDDVLGPAETIATQPGSAAAMFASIPKWAIPVGLGVLALGVGAVVLSKRKA
jgi:hypothetical protein